MQAEGGLLQILITPHNPYVFFYGDKNCIILS